MLYSNLGKHLFLGISSTNIDTLVPSLYQCVEIRNIEVFASVAISTGRPGRALSATFDVLEIISRPSCVPLYATYNSQQKQDKFLYEYHSHQALLLFSSKPLKGGYRFGY
jgi:hypothetical protein